MLRGSRRLSALGCTLAALAACGGDGPADPGTGSIEVTAVSTGEDLDTDGYTIVVDGSGSVAIDANATATVTDAAAGDRTVSLTGIQANCAVGGENPRTVSVTGGAAAAVQFDVECRDALINQIAFASSREDLLQVWVMNLDGSGPVRISGEVDGVGEIAHTASVSPDGTRIVYMSLLGGAMTGELVVRNADGTEPVNLTNNPLSDRDPAWSPDGSRLAFVSDRNGDQEVFVMSSDGTGVVNLTDSPASDEVAPMWSPDGSRILFTTDRDGNLELYVMNADGSEPVNLTNDPDVDWNASWSLDGSRIAFQTNRTGDYEIFLMNADGSDLVNITTDPASDLHPAWSPDGARIAFSSLRTGDSELFLINPDGSALVNISNDPASEMLGPQPWGLIP
jgi:Tol biopolymer transport system component